MKFMKAACLLLLCLLTAGASAQNVTKATITFHTTSDDKDGDSQIRDRIVCDNQDFLKLECCSAGKHSKDDHFDDGSTKSRDMRLITPLRKERLRSCSFVAGLTAKGNDRWIAIYTLDVTYQDGSREQFSFGEITLNSRNSGYVQEIKPIR